MRYNQQLLAAAVIAAFAAGGMSGVMAADDKKQGASSSGASQDKSRSAAGGASGKSAEAPSPNAPVIVLMPIAVVTKSNLSDGCWARLYDSTDFKGNQLTLVGPVDMPNMRTAFGTDWSGQFDSLQTGPKATLTVFDNENYKEKAATFKAGQKVKDLDEKMGSFEQVRSVKIACAGGGKTAQQGQDSSAASGSSSSGSGSSAAASGGKTEKSSK